MEEAEDQDPDDVTTEEIFDLIGNVDAIYDQLKEVEILKYKFKRSKKAKEIAEQKRDEYQDLLRQSESENYELKKSNVSLDQHNKLLKEFNDLKAEHHGLVNWAEIRYQKVNQELIDVKDKHSSLEKEYSELKDHSKNGQALHPTKSSRTRTKKHKDVKVQQQEEDVLDDSPQLGDLQEVENNELNQLNDLTTKFNILQERYNKVTSLNDQLQKEIRENDSKYQNKIHAFTDQVRNRDAEIRKLVEKLDTLDLQISLPRDDPILTSPETIESKNWADNMPVLFNDTNKVEKRQEMPVQLQQQNGLEESQKTVELERIASSERNRVKELTNKLAVLQEFHRNEMKVLKDRLQKQFNENTVKNQKTIDTLSESLKHKDAEMKTFVEELNSLHLQINLLKEDLELENSRKAENLPAFNDTIDIPHLQPQLVSGDETSDPATDEINTILKEMKHSIKLISPVPFESTIKVKEAQPIAEPTQETLNVFVNRLNRKLIMKQKELKMSNKRLCISRRNLTEAKKESWLKNNELIVTKKELCLIKNELRMFKNKLHIMKRYANLKRANRNCNRVSRDQATQCTETSSKIEELPPPSPRVDMTPTEKKAFTQQLKMKKFLKQQLLDDIRKWHTDSFLSYPSAESDMESGLSQSTIRRKKFRKQRHKQLVHASSDEDEVALSKDTQKKKAEKPEKRNEAEADVASSETIYAKVQGSVDSGYVKTDSGEESDVQNEKRKISEHLAETCKKQRCTKIAKTKEVVPENPADVKRWTRAMVKLFGTDSESCSPCIEPKTLKMVTQKPTGKYLQRVEFEKSLYESSDSDCLRGFVNGCYSSVPKSYVLGASPLNVAKVTTRLNTSRLTKKQKNVTKQKLESPSKEQNINLILNDLHLSEDYSTTCTETEANTRNVLLGDGTQSLTCTVISNKALSTPTNRRNPKKVKASTHVPIKMTLRSASKRTDDESAKSSSDCRTSHSEPVRNQIHDGKSETIVQNLVTNSESLNIRRSQRISARKSKAVSTTDDEKCLPNSIQSATDEDSITNSHYSKNSNNLLVISAKPSGTTKDKTRTESESLSNSENSETKRRSLIISAKPSGTTKDKTRSESESLSNNENSETKRRSLRISAKPSETTKDKTRSESESLSNNENSETKRRSLIISAKPSGTTKDKTRSESESLSNSENSETKRRSLIISAKPSGTTKDKTRSESESLSNNENSETKRRSLIISAKPSEITKDKTTSESESLSSIENSETKRRSLRISAKPSATTKDKTTSESESLSSIENSETKRRSLIISAKPSEITKDKTRSESESLSNNENSETKRRSLIISARKSGDESFVKEYNTNGNCSETKGKLLKIASGTSGNKECRSSEDEPRTTCKKFINDFKNYDGIDNKLGIKRKHLSKSKSSDENPESKRISLIISAKPSGTTKDKTRSESESLSNNENSETKRRSLIISAKPSGTTKDKTRSESESLSNNENSETKRRSLIISAKPSGTTKDKARTESESLSNSENSETKRRSLIISAKPSGTTKDKTRSESESLSNSENSETKRRSLIISAKPSGTTKDKTRSESESLSNNENSETKRRSLIISAKPSGTTKDKTRSESESLSNSENSETKRRSLIISAKPSGTTKDKTRSESESLSNSENSETKRRSLIISAKPSGTTKDKTRSESESLSNNENSETKRRSLIISAKPSGTTKDKTRSESESLSNSENSETKRRSLIISAKPSGTTKDKTRSESESLSNSENSETKRRSLIISAKPSGTTKDKTRSESESLSNSENSETKRRSLIISAKPSGTTKDKTRSESESLSNSENSETKRRSLRISARKSGDESFVKEYNTNGNCSETKGKLLKIASGTSGNKECRSSDDEPRTTCKKFIDFKNYDGTDKKLGIKRKHLSKSKSSDENPEIKKDSSQSTNKIPKLIDKHLTTNSLTNDQLLARKRMAETLQLTAATNKSNEKISFKRPNTRRKAMEPPILPSPDAKLATKSQPTLKPTVLPALDVEVTPNFIAKDPSVEPLSQVNTLGPNELPSSDVRNATLRLPDLPALELPNLPSLDSISFESPASPSLAYESQHFFEVGPKSIPLEPQIARPSQARSLLNQLLHYSKSGAMAQEVTNALLCENPHFIAKLILEVTCQDIHARVELFNYRRAPLLTIIQRLMLGLLLDLEEKGLQGVINSFLIISEQFLLTLRDPSHISPTARLHAAICKLQFDYKRMRLMLCKAIFFMGDAAVPYFYVVLCSWLELIPLNSGNLIGHDALETRTLIQLIRLKQCKEPKYNQHNLQTLLNKYYGYSFDREDSEKLLEDLFKCYVGRKRTVLEDATAESMMYLILALCESLDKTVLFKQLDRLKICLAVATTDLEMYNIIYLVGVITSQYCEDADVCADVGANKEWLQQFCRDSYSEYVSNAAKDVLRKL